MSDSQPEKRSLPARELEIVARLKTVREFLRLTQTEFANQIGISRHRIASHEEGRAPLRWEVALRACRQFFISERWLATGAASAMQLAEHKCVPFGPYLQRWTMGLALDPVTHAIRPGMYFSEAFDVFLRAQYDKKIRGFRLLPKMEFLETDNPEFYRNALSFCVAYGEYFVPPFLLPNYFYRLMQASAILSQEFTLFKSEDGEEAYRNEMVSLEVCLEHELRQLMVDSKTRSWAEKMRWMQPFDYSQSPWKRKAPGFEPCGPKLTGEGKKNLTLDSEFRNVCAMQYPSLKSLLKDAARLAEAKGKKAELADFVKVPRPRVSEWLHGKYEPGGESTLRLLEWVQAEEAKQQKSPGSVTAPPEARPKERNQKYVTPKKRKSGPRQK